MPRLVDYPVIVVVFGQVDCGACKGYLPVFRAAARRYPRVPSTFVDAATAPAWADHYKIRETPTTLLLRHGWEDVRLLGHRDANDLTRLFTRASRGF